MTWIREAQEGGRRIAEERDRAKREEQMEREQYDAEIVTPGTMAGFMEPYLAPVQSVVDDLRKAGFFVDEKEPDFIIDASYMSNDEPLTERGSYTLIKEVTTAEGKKHLVFGKEWTISRDMPHGIRKLGAIRMYPKGNVLTHFHSVEYQAYRIINTEGEQFRGTFSSPDTNDEVVNYLRSAVGAWIETDYASGRTIVLNPPAAK